MPQFYQIEELCTLFGLSSFATTSIDFYTRLSNERLDDLLQFSTSKTLVDVDKIIKEKKKFNSSIFIQYDEMQVELMFVKNV